MPSTSKRRAGASRQQPAPRRQEQRRDQAAATQRPALPPAPVEGPAGRGAVRRHRLAAALALILAPAAYLGGQIALLPVAGQGAGLGVIAEHLGAWRLAYTLLLAYSVLTVPLALGLGHLLRRRAPLWADAGSVLAVAGALAATGIALLYLVIAEMAAAGGGEQYEALLDRLGLLYGVLDRVEDMVLLGLVLLTLGLYRYQAAPATAIGLLLAGLGLSWGPAGLQVTAAVLQLAGLGWLGVTVLRWPDERWREPPDFAPMQRPVLFAAVMTLVFLTGVAAGTLARFLALVAVFLVLVIYRPVPAGPVQGGADAHHPT